MLVLADAYASGISLSPSRSTTATIPTRYSTSATSYSTSGGPKVPTGPVAPLPPVVYPTTSTPPNAPANPVQEIPGAGPVATDVSPTQWWNLFDPASFAWWKPVLVSSAIALFGGAVLAALAAKK